MGNEVIVHRINEVGLHSKSCADVGGNLCASCLKRRLRQGQLRVNCEQVCQTSRGQAILRPRICIDVSRSLAMVAQITEPHTMSRANWIGIQEITWTWSHHTKRSRGCGHFTPSVLYACGSVSRQARRKQRPRYDSSEI